MELVGVAQGLASAGGVLFEEETRSYSCDAGEDENVKDRDRKSGISCVIHELATRLRTASIARRPAMPLMGYRTFLCHDDRVWTDAPMPAHQELRPGIGR